MEKGKAGVEVESDREFHFGHRDSFSKHPNGCCVSKLGVEFRREVWVEM